MAGLACSGSDEQVPDAGLLISQLYHTDTDEDEVYISIYTDPMADPSQCRAFLNDWEIPGEWFTEGYGGVQMGVIVTGLGLKAGYIAQMAVESDKGDAEATLNLPDTISISGLEDGDTLPMGDVVVTWDSTADFYDFWAKAILYSPSGDSLGYKLIWIYTNDTTYTIPRDSLRPTGGGYSKLTLDIDPVNGVMPRAGAGYNMQGSLKGCYYVVNTLSSVISCYVGTPARLCPGAVPGKSVSQMSRRLTAQMGY